MKIYDIETTVSPAGSGTVTGAGTYDAGATVKLTATAGTGYSFHRWKKGDTSTYSTVNPLSFTAGENVTYTAEFTNRQWKVTYEKGSYGTGDSSSAIKTYGTALTLPGAKFTRTGYTQTGWSTSWDGGQKDYDLGGSYTTEASDTLYPYWTANTYTIRFNGHGATDGSTANVDCTYGVSAKLTKNGFTKTASDFVDWTTNEDGSGTHYSDQASVLNLSSTNGGIVDLYAQWSVRQHQVTVSVDPMTSGWGYVNPSGTSSYGEGSQLQLLATPYEGYVFNRWTDGSTDNPRTVTVTGPATYKAVFAKKTYTIQFDANGGSGNMSDIQATCHEDCVLPANTFSNGLYPFKSWNTRADGYGTTYRDEETVNLSNSNGLTLHAQWDKTGYTLRIYPCGGIYAGESQSVEYRELYPLIPQSTNLSQIGICASTNGAPFKGYYSDRNGSGTQVYDANGNRVTGSAYWTADGKYNRNSGLSVYAFWGPAPGNVEVAFAAQPAEAGVIQVDYDHRQVISNDFALTVIEGSNFVMTASVTNNGYSFCCWTNTLGVMTNANPWTYAANAVVTNIAVFTGNVYKVTYDPCDGEPDELQEKFVTFGGVYGDPPNPVTRAGYKLDGWYTKTKGRGDRVDGTNRVNVADDIDLYANWVVRQKYTIHFEGNGATSGTMDDMTSVYCGEPTALTSNAFLKTGYTFQCWKTNDTGKVFADGEIVTDLAPANETNTLYAVWSNNIYTVKFDKNGGGDGRMNPQTFMYDVAQPLSPCGYDPPTGLDFLGWSNAVDNATYTNKQVVSNLCTQAGDEITLYAIWGVNVGEYSCAMGCDNLKWEPEGTADPPDWVIVQDGVKSEKPKTAYHLAATIRTSGTIRFTWKSDVYSDAVFLRLVEDAKIGAQLVCELPLVEGKDGAENSYHIGIPASQSSIVLRFGVDSDIQTASHVLIKSVTWEPDAAHPMPEEKDKATISSVTASGGKFSLSFDSDEKFAYNLLTNANLLINSWGVMTNAVGTGKTITFDPPILNGQPQLFYKVETIQRQD